MFSRIRLVSITLFAFCIIGFWGIQSESKADNRGKSVDASRLKLPKGPVIGKADKMIKRTGEVNVVVRLTDPPLAAIHGKNAKQHGFKLSRDGQNAHLRMLSQKQSALMSQIGKLGGRELARLTKALNGVVVAIDASKIKDLRGLPGVQSVRRIRDYKLDLTETVPYIGAPAVHSAGFDGTGVTVAVLDSGMDYTHIKFGGPGTIPDYNAAYGTTTADPLNTTRDGLFPTAKVIEGFDFLGEVWPGGGGVLTPDPDPIDCGPGTIPSPCAGGHGSHVADIIAGTNGVAPGASLLAVKVCSAVSSSCSGVALLQAIDFALDPNGDGDLSDAADVINMSLGSPYGMIEDDLSFASHNAVQLGVVVVASAGNSANLPYIVGSPSSTRSVISVAQTHVPSGFQNFLEVLTPPNIAGDYIAVYQPWSPALTSTLTGPVQYGDGAGGNLNGCAAFAAGSLTGKIVLVDRGTCAFSIKGANVSAGGGLAAVIGLVAPGPPFEGAYGGGVVTVPTFMISQADSNTIKSELATGVTAQFDPANGVPLVMSIVGTSSRGPNFSLDEIKPDIAAPGASVSAQAGTGTAETSFGGTSGAAPMVTGSAALILDAYPNLAPHEVKARLMNTGETNILTDPVTLPGELAPITRIGGGEVRVDDAFNATTAAWDKEYLVGSLSFGAHVFPKPDTLKMKVEVHNYGTTTETYDIASAFRYANDQATGAITFNHPAQKTVGPGKTKTFKVKMHVDPSLLPPWTLDGGFEGNNGQLLQDLEYDGFINLSDSKGTIHLPWHILPHKASQVNARKKSVNLDNSTGTGSTKLKNKGVIDGVVEVFSWTDKSDKIPDNQLPGPGDNFAIIDMRSIGTRLVAPDTIQFAVSTFGDRSHPNFPAEFDILIDNNRDGTPDFIVFNFDLGALTTGSINGQNVTWVFDLTTADLSAFFFTDADLNSSNVILTAPLSAMGMTDSTQFDFQVFAFDNYFTGDLTDQSDLMTYTSDHPHFTGSVAGGVVPANGNTTLDIQEVASGSTASPSQLGLLLFYRNAPLDKEEDTITVIP